MPASEIVIQQVNPLDVSRWDEAVAEFPGASFFHSAAWARVLKETYAFTPRYFVAKDAEGRLLAVVPVMEVSSWLTGSRGVSLPFTDSCEPLFRDPNALLRVFEAITAHGRARRWKHWELRGGTTALGAPASIAYHGHQLALTTDSARLLARCDSAVRRAIRKAEQEAISVTFGHDLETVRAFHGLLCKTRRRHGLPPQPFQFFAHLQREVLANGKGCVALARHGHVPVAGAVFLHFSQGALFKFGASDEAFQHLRPNNLVMWRAIDWHARAGFSSLDFGRTSISNEGLRRFKLGWGTTESRLEYVRFDCRTAAFVTARDHTSGWHNGLFKILPSALARLLGAAAYKHVA